MQQYDNAWLIKRLDQDSRIKYVFFWGHRKSVDGTQSKSCFSQWYDAPFNVNGERFATAEHWMMAEKASLFGDEEMRAKIMANPKPGAAKAYGREVRKFDQGLWDDHRMNIAIEGNFHKFSSRPELSNFLTATGNRVLVEASPVDAIWGIGLEQNDPKAEDPRQWPGLNLLGYALMSVRDRLLARR